MFAFFTELERLGGKDGNGIYNYTDDKVWKSYNSMPIDANIIGGILFHTRYATNGLVKNYNVQPFLNKRYVFVHNGIFNGIDNFARLVGFPFSDRKYSDSYMMAYVLEQVGLFNFYNGLRDKYYGVIVVYDRTNKLTYLLKTGGTFTYGQLASNGKYIYGSAILDNWKLKEKAKDFGKGLYILGGTTLTKLDTIKGYQGYQSSNSAYNAYKKSTTTETTKAISKYEHKKPKEVDGEYVYENALGNEICAYCGFAFAQNEKYKVVYDSHICDACYNQYYEEVDETEPTGIGALFNDMPPNCQYCKWSFENACWYKGIEQEVPIQMINEYGLTSCNTHTTEASMIVKCDNCGDALELDDDWSMVDRVILCEECKTRLSLWDKSCEDCEWKFKPNDVEPCATCWDNQIPEHYKKGTPDSWREQIEDDNENDDENDEDNDIGEREKYENYKYSNLKCSICGIHFDEGDEYLDIEGEIVCDECEEWSFVPYEGITDDNRKVYNGIDITITKFERDQDYRRLG